MTEAAIPNAPTQQAMAATVLSPRFYTTDFAALEKVDVSSVRAKWDALLEEFKADPNKGHFARDSDFKSRGGRNAGGSAARNVGFSGLVGDR